MCSGQTPGFFARIFGYRGQPTYQSAPTPAAGGTLTLLPTPAPAPAPAPAPTSPTVARETVLVLPDSVFSMLLGKASRVTIERPVG
jgi:hypothetical protein